MPVAKAAAVPARRPQEAVLRELLLRRVGWAPALEPSARVTVRGRQHLLTPLARGEGWRVCLCDSPGRAALPAYELRRGLHLRAGGAGDRTVTVFTDAAATRQVWGWTRHRAFAAPAYTEVYRSAEAGAEDGGMPLPEVEVNPLVDDPAAARAGAQAALAVLTERLRRSADLARPLRRGRGRSTAESLQQMIERSRTPQIARRVWAEVQMIRILDPTCGSGSWLSGCLQALGAAAAACLQRMQAWVEDAPADRAERHLDLRQLLARSRELARSGVRDRFALEMVLLRCLRGVDADALAAVRCRRVLVEQLSGVGGAAESGAAEAFADVRVGLLVEGVRSAEELVERARREPAIAAVAAALGEEAEALARAEEQLIRMRLRGGAVADDLREGRQELQRRRLVLTGLLGATAHQGGPAGPLHLWVEYNGIIRAGGFHLVRGGEAPATDRAAHGAES